MRANDGIFVYWTKWNETKPFHCPEFNANWYVNGNFSAKFNDIIFIWIFACRLGLLWWTFYETRLSKQTKNCAVFLNKKQSAYFQPVSLCEFATFCNSIYVSQNYSTVNKDGKFSVKSAPVQHNFHWHIQSVYNVFDAYIYLYRLDSLIWTTDDHFIGSLSISAICSIINLFPWMEFGNIV